MTTINLLRKKQRLGVAIPAQTASWRSSPNDIAFRAQHQDDVSVVVNVSGRYNDDMIVLDFGAIFRLSDDLAFDEHQGPTLRLVKDLSSPNHIAILKGYLRTTAGPYSHISMVHYRSLDEFGFAERMALPRRQAFPPCHSLRAHGARLGGGDASCNWPVRRDGVNHWFPSLRIVSSSGIS